MWEMEIRCGMGIWDATMEFPFQEQGSILPIGFGGLKWNFRSGKKSIRHIGFHSAEWNFHFGTRFFTESTKTGPPEWKWFHRWMGPGSMVDHRAAAT
jgi:hypothetical protein